MAYIISLYTYTIPILVISLKYFLHMMTLSNTLLYYMGQNFPPIFYFYIMLIENKYVDAYLICNYC